MYKLSKPKKLKPGKLERPCIIEEKIDGWRMVIWEGNAYGRSPDNLGRWINKWEKLPDFIQSLASSTPVDGEVYWPGKDSAAVATGLKERSPELEFIGFRIANKKLYPLDHLKEVNRLGIKIPEMFYPDYVEHPDIERLMEVAKDDGIEGWVLKEKFMTEVWWKLKVTETYDVIVTGLKWPLSGKNKINGWIKSLVCSAYRDGILVEVANVSGMTDEVRASISEKDIGRVIEVEANLLASKGKLKHPRFIRWRDDKNEKECRI
jgi:hypothetical protein|tara:strand:+ start:741 stop:1529 length:789 start_codon:yes stop_codon:yes gene_type:complete